ncbi:MAG: hypothetical protein GY798_25805 [Hyphomicrobiales bacterium]|nr:hypothetical protein [Hyphomicrobiales bacterium]
MTDLVVFGFGALGTRLHRVLEGDYPDLTVSGVIDRDPAKAGRKVRELCDSNRFGDLTVAPDLQTYLANAARLPDVLVHMTESRPERIEPQLIEGLEAGINVLSASEAMFYPALRFPAFSARLDLLARAHGLTVSGGGINPGFVYDVLPLVLARATSGVTAIKIHRTIDVTGTGPGDIEHVGYGLLPEEFRNRLKTGQIVGHMGAPESVALIAEFLGLPIDLVTESWDIETADFEVDSGDPTLGILPPGRVIGITQKAQGSNAGRATITTELRMYYQPERFGLEESDRIDIEGAMPVNMTVRPAFQSLFGAANIVASLIADFAMAAPGLVNLLDLPLGAGRRSAMRLQIDPSRAAEPGRVPLRAVTA